MSTVSDSALAALAKLEEIKERNRLYAARRREVARQATLERNDLSTAVVGLTQQLERLQQQNDHLRRQVENHHCVGCVCGGVAHLQGSTTRPDSSVSFSFDKLANYRSDNDPLFDNASLSPLPINEQVELSRRLVDPVAPPNKSTSQATRPTNVPAPRRCSRRGTKRLSLG